MPQHIECHTCGEFAEISIVSKVPIKSKRYTDYKITYRCIKCGSEWTQGGS